MKEKITWPSKLMAISFIGLILMTNLWLHNYLFGGNLPQWAFYVIDLCTVGVFVGALAHIYLWIQKRLTQNNDDQQ